MILYTSDPIELHDRYNIGELHQRMGHICKIMGLTYTIISKQNRISLVFTYYAKEVINKSQFLYLESLFKQATQKIREELDIEIITP